MENEELDKVEDLISKIRRLKRDLTNIQEVLTLNFEEEASIYVNGGHSNIKGEYARKSLLLQKAHIITSLKRLYDEFKNI